ncbi:hypothetical protein [Dyella terrae]|uniref:hypothetical protein n=1 Tax=Dyella terrae TaxID=522259 RepID=UPI0013F14A07|nr:hypothetical protein [Dyella terrae]
MARESQDEMIDFIAASGLDRAAGKPGMADRPTPSGRGKRRPMSREQKLMLALLRLALRHR